MGAMSDVLRMRNGEATFYSRDMTATLHSVVVVIELAPSPCLPRPCCCLRFCALIGEILRFLEDERLRKHSPRMFPLIKIESQGIEDDQIPS